MNCVVTAGPSYQPLDEVRRLTNFSTGQLGVELAEYLAGCGHQVTLLRGSGATHQQTPKAAQVLPFTTNSDLETRLQALAQGHVDALFHAAAVSDYAFGKTWKRLPTGELTEIKAGKLPTRWGPLLVELIPAAKIIHGLREWFPRAWLAGWKYEVDGDRASAMGAAQRQIAESRTDACVVNGPAYGEGFGLLTEPGNCRHLTDANALFEALAQSLADRERGRQPV